MPVESPARSSFARTGSPQPSASVIAQTGAPLFDRIMTSSVRRGARQAFRLLACSMILAAGSATAQPSQAYGTVQQVPPPDAGADLRRSLATVGTDPNNITALVESGRSALAMGDPQAALTFFSRADEVAPRDARIKAGMASAMTLLGQPRPALTLFAEAQSLGAPELEIASDRGLAHDLLGDPRAAQRDYALVLRRRDDDETRRRLALSLAISGQREPALRLLEPQIRRNDRAGWRTQAFVLALTGDAAGAARVAAGTGPAGTAEAMAPFLGRLPALSPAQRAMAVHLGVFPSDGRAQYAANIDTTPDPGALSLAGGPARPTAPTVTAVTEARRDERAAPRRQRASSPVERAAVAPPSQRREVASAQPQRRLRPYLIPGPSGELRTTRVSRAERSPQPVAEQPVSGPAAAASRFAPPPAEQEPAAPVEQSPAPAAQDSAPIPPAPATSVTEAVDPAILAGVRPGDTIAAPGFSLTPRPAQPSPTIPAPSEQTNSALGDIAMVVNDLRDQGAPAAPVQATRQVAPPAQSAPAPAQGRHWVQIAGNLDRASMAGELRRLRGRAPALLDGMQGWTARTGATGRLLVGPFGSARDAQAFVNQLRPRGIEGVAWSNAAGQSVERLAGATEPARTARATPERRTATIRGRSEQRESAATSRSARGRNEEARAGTRSGNARGRAEETRAGTASRNARGRTETARSGTNARETRVSPRSNSGARETRSGSNTRDTRGNARSGSGRDTRPAPDSRSNRRASTVERRANDRDARPSRGRPAPEQRPTSRRARSN